MLFGDMKYLGRHIAILQGMEYGWQNAGEFSMSLGKVMRHFCRQIGLGNATDITRNVSRKFSNLLGKMLGHFGGCVRPQNATNVVRNVPWTAQPTAMR